MPCRLACLMSRRGLVAFVACVGAVGSGPESVPSRIEVRGIENVFQLSPKLYSGGQPEGVASFEALKALGVRTIVSVDGAAPDVENARKLGLRYVHLPVGYDGIPREQAVRLVKAVDTLPGPVFVHCHHGKHRGPAAAALAGIAREGWTREQAVDWMKQAGTSPDYTGLFASVREFTAPTARELDRVRGPLPERADVPGLVASMVRIDQRWDNLKAVREAGFRSPPGHPDVDPPHEALQLAEGFRELSRLDASTKKGLDFVRRLEQSERHANALHAALLEFRNDPTDSAREKAAAAFVQAGKSCTTCHTRYRDQASDREGLR